MTKIQINGQISKTFDMENGIKQSDSLSPLLCIIAMDGLVKSTRGKEDTKT